MTHVIELKAGQSVRISIDVIDGALEIVAAEGKKRRGPISLPKTSLKARQLHRPVMAFVRKNGPVTSEAIRAHIQKKFADATTNIIAWALVELQNENCERGKNRPKTGPLVKNENGTYSAR